MIKESDIPNEVLECARVKLTEEDEDGVADDETASLFRMDVIWAHISCMKLTDENLKFGRLCKVAKTVLILPHSKPHSNAGKERVFSMIRKNKTPFRGSLAVNGTLSSLMTIKLANCHQFEAPLEVLTSAKKATRNNNLLHKKS